MGRTVSTLAKAVLSHAARCPPSCDLGLEPCAGRPVLEVVTVQQSEQNIDIEEGALHMDSSSGRRSMIRLSRSALAAERVRTRRTFLPATPTVPGSGLIVRDRIERRRLCGVPAARSFTAISTSSSRATVVRMHLMLSHENRGIQPQAATRMPVRNAREAATSARAASAWSGPERMVSCSMTYQPA